MDQLPFAGNADASAARLDQVSDVLRATVEHLESLSPKQMSVSLALDLLANPESQHSLQLVLAVDLVERAACTTDLEQIVEDLAAVLEHKLDPTSLLASKDFQQFRLSDVVAEAAEEAKKLRAADMCFDFLPDYSGTCAATLLAALQAVLPLFVVACACKFLYHLTWAEVEQLAQPLLKSRNSSSGAGMDTQMPSVVDLLPLIEAFHCAISIDMRGSKDISRYPEFQERWEAWVDMHPGVAKYL